MISTWKFKTLEECVKADFKIDLGGKGNGIVQAAKLKLPVPSSVFLDVNLVKYQELMNDSLSAQLSNDGDFTLIHLKQVLGSGPWIFRSSMNIEDSGVASFAGCFKSICIDSVDSVDLLLKTSIEVLQSAFTPQAEIRILSEGIHPGQVMPGFFIQKWIKPVLAGVCFTRSPNHLWVKGNGAVEWGTHGEGVVQGTLDKNETGFVLKNDQIPKELEGFWHFIWEYSEKLEKHFQAPAEWEWVWDGKTLWVVQARLVATEEAQLIARTRPGGRWTRELSLERFPEPLTPMGWTVLQDVFESNIQSLENRFGIIAQRPEDIAVCLNGIVYSDPDFFKFPSGVKIDWTRYFLPWKKTVWRLGLHLLSWLKNRLSGKNKKVTRSIVVLEILNSLMKEQADDILRNWSSHKNYCLNELRRFSREGITPSKTPLNLSSEDVLEQMENIRKLSLVFMEPDLAIFLIKDTFYKALLDLWIALEGDSTQFTQSMLLSDGNCTLDMNLDWENVVSSLRGEQKESLNLFYINLNKSKNINEVRSSSSHLQASTHQAWNNFLSRNGHLRTTWDVAVPSWSENISQLIPLLQVSINSPRKLHPKKMSKDKEVAPVHFHILTEMFQALDHTGFSQYKSLVQDCFQRVEDYMRMDEEQHFLSGLLVDSSRELILQSGAILEKQSVLEQSKDVFFLKLEELKKALQTPTEMKYTLSYLTRKRETEWKRAFNSDHPYELPPSLGAHQKSPNAPESADNKILAGIGVSPGKTEGILHFVEHLMDAEGIPQDAILVTTSPNPSLTPFFPLLSGLISATGGPLSHGFVAAREYGLPAVSGIPVKAGLLKPGMRLRMDGSTGTLEILEERANV